MTRKNLKLFYQFNFDANIPLNQRVYRLRAKMDRYRYKMSNRPLSIKRRQDSALKQDRDTALYSNNATSTVLLIVPQHEHPHTTQQCDIYCPSCTLCNPYSNTNVVVGELLVLVTQASIRNSKTKRVFCVWWENYSMEPNFSRKYSKFMSITISRRVLRLSKYLVLLVATSEQYNTTWAAVLSTFMQARMHNGGLYFI